jgi:hypothetical protein
VTLAAVAVIVGVTLPVEMLVLVGMGVLVIVLVGMLVGVCHAVVGVLVGVAMLVAVVMMAQMILVNVHTISPCFFLSLYPQKAGKSISISPETKKPPSDEGGVSEADGGREKSLPHRFAEPPRQRGPESPRHLR